MADHASASASSSNRTAPTAPGATPSTTSPPLPPLLSRLSSPRAAPASVSAINAVSVTGSSRGAPAATATAALSKRDESMLRVVRGPDRVTPTASPSTVTASAASLQDLPASSVSSVSLPVHGGPPGPDALANAPPPQLAGPSSVATAPAALTSAPFAQLQPGAQRDDQPSLPPPPPLASRLQPSLPSASAQRHITEARQAIDASIANLLDSQLQGRAELMHSNMRAISGQQHDLGKAVVGLRKANDDLAHLVHETLGPLKEVGNVQNWTEMQYQSLSGIEETLRLVRERRERREQAAAVRQARREARQAERAVRLEAGEDVGSGDESDGSGSFSSSYYTSSYFSGSNRSRSRSRSVSPDCATRAAEPRPATVSQGNKGKGKAKMEDLVENVRAAPTAASRRNEPSDTGFPGRRQPRELMDLSVSNPPNESPNKGKGKEAVDADDSVPTLTGADAVLPTTETEESQTPAVDLVIQAAQNVESTLEGSGEPKHGLTDVADETGLASTPVIDEPPANVEETAGEAATDADASHVEEEHLAEPEAKQTNSAEGRVALEMTPEDDAVEEDSLSSVSGIDALGNDGEQITPEEQPDLQEIRVPGRETPEIPIVKDTQPEETQNTAREATKETEQAVDNAPSVAA